MTFEQYNVFYHKIVTAHVQRSSMNIYWSFHHLYYIYIGLVLEWWHWASCVLSVSHVVDVWTWLDLGCQSDPFMRVYMVSDLQASFSIVL